MGERYDFTQHIRAEQEELIRECGLTDREASIFRMRARDASVIETSMALHLSERTVERDSRKIRCKIAKARHRIRESACPEEADAP